MSNIENTIDRIQELLEDIETEQQLREGFQRQPKGTGCRSNPYLKTGRRT